MAIELHELIFDPATLEGAKVGSYIVGANGNVLNINADNSMPVALDAASLAALENITVTVSNEVEIKNDAGSPVPMAETFGTIKHSNQTVNTTASQLAATPLASRKKMIVQNLGSKDVYIGTSTVTATTGVKIPSGGNVELPYNASVALYGITASGTADIRILEAA
jgi:hypothetical protein